MTGVTLMNAWPSVKRPCSPSKNTTPSIMSDKCTNFAMSGYRRGNQTQKESKPFFLNTARTISIRQGSIVRVPEILGGKPLEGRVLFVDTQETPMRRLDGSKLLPYFTVCINEKSLCSLLIFQHTWEKVEVLHY